MPGPNDPLLIDPRLGSLLVSASGHLSASPSGRRGAPLAFGPPAAPGEAGTLGPYRVVSELGRGAMGAVFLAVDTRLDRRLALKVMLPEIAAAADARARFLREARAAARIGHDNVVTVFEADERDGVPYIAMQLLQGYPLDAFLQEKGPPSLRSAVRIAREAALGLAAAHKLGIVHRDVKPANLWLEAPHGRVKLLDFGLARAAGADTELTQTGMLIGTPAFMSPEQALGERVDHRTDLFSLGAVLYWLCTGRLPFPGPSVWAVLKALSAEEPQPVAALAPGLPGPLAELIHQLLAKAPGARPQSATEVANRLGEVPLGTPDAADDLSEDLDPWSAFVRSAVAQQTEPALLPPAPVGGRPDDVDPWLTFVRSAASQQAGPPPLVTNEPRLIHSMQVVAITPAALVEEPREGPEGPQPKPNVTRTVISSGVLWEEVEDEAPRARPKRPVRAEEEEREPAPRRPRRAAKRARRARGPAPLVLGAGAAALIAISVIVTLLAVSGKKGTEPGGESAKPVEAVPQSVKEEDEPAKGPVPAPPPSAKGPEARDAVPAEPRFGASEVILGARNGPVFRDEAPPGGLLVGFDVWCGLFGDYEVLDGVRPIYRIDGRDVFGGLHGRITARPYRVVAKPGYAVGGLSMKAGLGPDSFAVVFMRVRGAKLDPSDFYRSERFGGPGGGSHPMLGGDGTPVTGIVGRVEGKSKLSGLGLTFPTRR